MGVAALLHSPSGEGLGVGLVALEPPVIALTYPTPTPPLKGRGQ
jgi:hypothetical protein